MQGPTMPGTDQSRLLSAVLPKLLPESAAVEAAAARSSPLRFHGGASAARCVGGEGPIPVSQSVCEEPKSCVGWR